LGSILHNIANITQYYKFNITQYSKATKTRFFSSICVNIHQYYMPKSIFLNIHQYYLSNLQMEYRAELECRGGRRCHGPLLPGASGCPSRPVAATVQ
jgi:hypothetical protein